MSEDFKITVGPVDGGWSVRCDHNLEPVMFLSGGRAEQYAKALAMRMSRAGRSAQVLVHDRTLALVGASRYQADLQDALAAA
jgi:hypothetical protein